MKSPSPSIPAPQHEIDIDISKDTLDGFDGSAHWQVTNDKAGIYLLITRLRKLSPRPSLAYH